MSSDRQAALWTAATDLVSRGIKVAMVKIVWDVENEEKTLPRGFTPRPRWQHLPIMTPDEIAASITKGCNAYLYRLPDDVRVIDADTPNAVMVARREFGAEPAVVTRKGGHWLFRATANPNLEGTVFDNHHPTQLYGPGSWYETPAGVAEYVGTVPDFATLPDMPAMLQSTARMPEQRLVGGSAITPTGFFAPAPTTAEQAKAAIQEKLDEIAAGSARQGSGGRKRIMGAAFTMGGYLHAGWFTHEEAIAELHAAITACYGSVNKEDDLWIAQGLRDGDKPEKRFRVMREKAPALTPDQVAGVEGGPFDLGDLDYYDNPSEPPEPIYGAFGGTIPLFYDVGVHWLQGESESGKTWVGLALVVEVLRAGGHVMIVDHEDTRPNVLNRLKALSMTRAEYGRLAYVSGSDVTHRELREHLATTDREYGLMLIDGVTSALNAAGLSGRDEGEVTRWAAELPLQARMAVCIDHVVKAIDDRRGMAIGSQAKKSVVTGSSWEVVATSMFGRGRNGTIELRIQKDKQGGIKGKLPDGRGVLKLDLRSTEGGSRVELAVADAGPMGGFLVDPHDALFGALYADGTDGSVSAVELWKLSKDRQMGYSSAGPKKASMLALWLAYYVERKDGESGSSA